VTALAGPVLKGIGPSLFRFPVLSCRRISGINFMQTRVGCLDGLRGLASLWVLIGHGMLLTGWRIPVISAPEFGVDLFIMISGFLMVFHYVQRREREPWESPSTWVTFWVRRFFRIAPLYYAALIAAIAFAPWLGEARDAIAIVVPTAATDTTRYADQSATNILLHLSFAFGALPDYGFRTALPDWSIGLEMQYYAAFPFLMLIIDRLGWRFGALAVAALGGVVFCSAPAFFLSFEMASALPLKLHIFLAGMLCAAATGQPACRIVVYAVLGALLAAIPIGGWVGLPALTARALLAAGLFGLIHWRGLSWVSALLGNRAFHWLGEMSYGLYLSHLLILVPVVAAVSGISEPPVRFAIAVAITAAASFATAWLGYRLIENPGRALGRRILRDRFRPAVAERNA
jgi:peptidoglycan/LPS O-acetylase OafA/YrhL